MGEELAKCPECEGPLVDGECLRCRGGSASAVRRWQTAIVLFVALAIAGFSFTRLAVNNLEAKKAELGATWFERGTAALQRGASAEAVDDFENALVYGPDNEQYRLRLVEALLVSGRTDEAQDRLVTMFERRPGDANVNLQMARTYARQEDVRNAVRYYEGAIYGVWTPPGEAPARRLDVRRELVTFLLDHGRKDLAQSQLSTLAEESPKTFEARLELARQFLRSGAARRAYDEALAARNLNRRNPSTLPVLGEAAFAANEFSVAERWLESAAEAFPEDEELASRYTQAQSVVLTDPFAEGISSRTRAQRILRAFEAADERLRECLAQRTGIAPSTQGQQAPATLDSLQQWADQMRPVMNVKRLQAQDDLREAAMRFVFSAEQMTSTCKVEKTPTDEALTLLSRQRWQAE